MTVLEQLRSSADGVSRACDLLAGPTPGALEDCAAVLDSAVRSLEALQSDLPRHGSDPEFLAEARRLQRSARRAAALLHHADQYHRGWREIVGVMSAGYGPGGLPGQPPPAGRIFVRG